MKNGYFNQKLPLLFNIYNAKILCINRQVCIFEFLGRFWLIFALKSCKKKLHKQVMILMALVVHYDYDLLPYNI